MIFLWILASVTASSFAQLLLKLGMSSHASQGVLRDGGAIAIVLTIGLNPLVIGGLLLYLLSAVVWLGVLSHMELSLAYPFVALGFVFTAVLSHLFIGEAINLQKIIGTTLIVVGVVVLAR
jgi:multidrug transporter EmrE-like cation transporter